MITMIVAIMMLLFFVSSCTITHLGRKPVSGGSPPRDRRDVRIIRVIVGLLFHRIDRVSVVVFVLMLSMVNKVMVNIR